MRSSSASPQNCTPPTAKSDDGTNGSTVVWVSSPTLPNETTLVQTAEELVSNSVALE